MRMLLRSLPTLLCLVATLSLAACGDDGESTVTSTETIETSTPSASTSTTTATAETTTGPAVDPAGITGLGAFSSPSGNIGCILQRSSVRCDIGDRDWEPPKAPADCELDYGQGITLSAGATPEFVCAGDTTLGAGPPLPYGESTEKGLLICESKESGITCRDKESGRGFTISTQRYELF